MVKENIIEKIKKLKSMGSSTNENEAALALEMMKKLIDKYNINDETLKQLQEDPDFINESEWVKPTEHTLKNWEINLGSAIAELFDCRIVISGKSAVYYNGYCYKRNRLLFIGSEFDTKITMEMFDWILDILSNVSKQKSLEERNFLKNLLQDLKDEGRIDDDEELPKAMRHDPISFTHSFMVGASQRISSRVNEILENRKMKYSDNEKALMIINTKLTKVNKKADEVGTEKVSTNVSFSNLNGHSQGKIIGDSINFDKQINNRSDLGQQLLR